MRKLFVDILAANYLQKVPPYFNNIFKIESDGKISPISFREYVYAKFYRNVKSRVVHTQARAIDLNHKILSNFRNIYDHEDFYPWKDVIS